MRNLLGRLHARRLPELLRIADAWSVPLHGESKGEVVATLYRAMADPRTARDLWDHLAPEERAIALALSDAPDAASAPTVRDLAGRLGVPEETARETALGLYRMGLLAREGDDEPLPIGAAPRLLMPREVAFNIRRIQDEMAAGDLSQSPLRVLMALLDDAELEGAARAWGLRVLPGMSRREELTNRLLHLVNDRDRLHQVVRGRGRDAAALWRIVRDAPEPVALADAARQVGLSDGSSTSAGRFRAALAELEGALLVWHTYHEDGSRWLFVPEAIRNPVEVAPATLPPLQKITLAGHDVVPWKHPDALAWDLLTVLRLISAPQSPTWEAEQPPPRWLQRIAATRLWFGGRDGIPAGYLELIQALGLAEGVLAVDEAAYPPRIVAGPRTRAWRGMTFLEQTRRLRDRWLRLPRWIEGEPAGIAEIWGADWRGMRPRLLFTLGDAEFGLAAEQWVTLESLAARAAARAPALLGPSFMAATARLAGEAASGDDVDRARQAALGDVIAFELSGPFRWFGVTRIIDRPGQPRAISLTESGMLLALRKSLPAEEDAGASHAPLQISTAGEITLAMPSPDRVWALSAFSELVDLGPESHYRLTPGSVGMALAAGIELDQIITYLERSARESLPAELMATLAAWAKGYRRVVMRRAVLLDLDDADERESLLLRLREAGWEAKERGARGLLVSLGPEGEQARDEHRLITLLRTAGLAPRWAEQSSESEALGNPATVRDDAGEPG